jgi:HlyD family secretion protein
MKGKWLYITLGVVASLIAVAIIGKKQGWIGNSGVEKVAVEKVGRRTITETVTASGKISPQTEVKLSSEVSGEVIELMVKEGDSVKKGQLLITINPAIYESMVTQYDAGVNQFKANSASSKANVLQAKATRDNAKISLDRNKKLHDDKVISDAEYEAAKLQFEQADASYQTIIQQQNAAGFNVKSAEAQLKQAKDNLLKTKLYAPMDGIVSLVNVKLGERVVGTAQMAGTELIRIADLANMQAEVDVNENDVLRIAVGDTAEIEVDAYIKKKFKGVVTQIGYSSTNSIQQVLSTSQATNFTVKIAIVKESYADLIKPEIGMYFPFRPGMSATADIQTEKREGIIVVPIQSVTSREEKDIKAMDADYGKTTAAQKTAKEGDKKDLKEIVWIVANNMVTAREVKTGIQDANYIEITEGLKEGEKVVKAPFKLISKTLRTGDLVSEVDEKDLFKDSKEEE